MKLRLRKIAILISRGGGLLAFALGCAYATGAAIPLACHIALGTLAVLALLCLSALAYRSAPFQALIAMTIGISVPILGMMQDGPAILENHARPLLVVCHMLCAIGAIALSELLNKKLKAITA